MSLLLPHHILSSPIKTSVLALLWLWLGTQLPIGSCGLALAQPNSRSSSPCDLPWSVRVRGESDWRPIQVADSWESVLGMQFDGIAEYRTTLPNWKAVTGPDTPSEENDRGGRVLLEFDGVATIATLKIDGAIVSNHIGAWTPWIIDITEHYKPGLEVIIEVDEKVGHNTQGFLPVFLPHFGGIWQKVRLTHVPHAYIAQQKCLAAAFVDDQTLTIEAPCYIPADHSSVSNNNGQSNAQASAQSTSGWSLGVSLIDNEGKVREAHWNELPRDADSLKNGPWRTAKISFSASDLARWSPHAPHRHRLRLELRDDATKTIVDQVEIMASVRTVTTEGRELRLNGKPLAIRGVLNWGYAPPRIAPSIDPNWMREEIMAAKQMGFNLMKFCLWVPPRPYLDLCDELGMLAWVEYPTWHPKFTPEFLPDLRREYQEFFEFDRNHPSVVLRSLTCETGHSADLKVIQELYDDCHAAIPGSIVEDDSSWISWNRVHDFYDDHPYGNNHTWEGTLAGLDRYIKEHGEKPLVLGEAIAADTWFDPSTPTIAPADAESQKVHGLRSAPKQAAYLKQIREWCGESAVQNIASDAHRNAIAMRKFQVEQFQGQLPNQGYTISVIRDFPLASMGLIGFDGKPKWSAEEWSWHRNRPARLMTRNHARSLETPNIQFAVEGRSSALKGRFGRLESSNGAIRRLTPEEPIQPATVETDDNQWPVWVVAPPDRWQVKQKVAAHSSIAKEDPRWGAFAYPNAKPEAASMRLASRLDLETLQWVEEGGRLLLLPDGKTGSFPIADHWFLRGGVIISDHPGIDPVFRRMIADLQIFDLAGPVIKSPDYLSEVTPLVLLWDNHDLDHYKTHALVFEMGVGKGRILVSTLNHDPDRGPAASYTLARFARILLSDQNVRPLSAESLTQLRSDLTVESRLLAKKGWSFKPDPKNEGLTQKWMEPAHDRSDWASIEIAQFWDGQGFGHVDGFAWYVKKLTLPPKTRFLTFTGVDDSFELYIEGKLVGVGGNRAKKESTFNEIVSMEILVEMTGKEVCIAIRVEDWQGAGGIFRPVYVSDQPWPKRAAILVRQNLE